MEKARDPVLSMHFEEASKCARDLLILTYSMIPIRFRDEVSASSRQKLFQLAFHFRAIAQIQQINLKQFKLLGSNIIDLDDSPRPPMVDNLHVALARLVHAETITTHWAHPAPNEVNFDRTKFVVLTHVEPITDDWKDPVRVPIRDLCLIFLENRQFILDPANPRLSVLGERELENASIF